MTSFRQVGRHRPAQGLGREPLNWVTMTSPAVVYKDLVIVGGAMSETLPASPADIRAFDAHSGHCGGLSIPFLIPANWLQHMAQDRLDL